MKKLINVTLLTIATLMVTGCDDSDTGSQRNVTAKYNLPTEMADCVIYRMSGGMSVNELTVVRCPNSTTSTTHQEGKVRRTTIVVDGVQYELTPKQPTE